MKKLCILLTLFLPLCAMESEHPKKQPRLRSDDTPHDFQTVSKRKKISDYLILPDTEGEEQLELRPTSIGKMPIPFLIQRLTKAPSVLIEEPETSPSLETARESELDILKTTDAYEIAQTAIKVIDGSICPDCKKTIKGSLIDISRHLLTHTGETPFKCDHPDCDYCCSQQSNLLRHKRKHTGEKPFKCDYPGCDFSTNASWYIKIHKRTHTGEKPFTCDFPGCDYSCAQKCLLKKHKRTHTGEKLFTSDHSDGNPCTEKTHPKKQKKTRIDEKSFTCNHPGCGYRCIKKSMLTRHKKIHTGEKPFRCDFQDCDYRCIRKNDLKTHMRTHTKEQPYRCDYPDCLSSFTTSSNLARHKRIKHAELMEKS